MTEFLRNEDDYTKAAERLEVPPMLAAAKRLQEANPDIPLVFIPLFDGPAGKGKYPNHPGGHFVEVTSGWQKRAVSVPDNHPAWAAATGYGIVLTHNPHLIIIDIDNEDALTLKQQAELHASPGLTYFTRKGQHHWYKVKPGDYPSMGGKNYARPWGETWHHTARQVAGPGSADKPAPNDLRIPEQIPPLDALLEQTEQRRLYDPKPAYATEWQPGQGPRHDWLLHTAYHYLRQRNATEEETKKALQSSAAYKSKAAEYGTAATDKELDDIIIWQQQQRPEEPEWDDPPSDYEPPTTTEEPETDFRLGELSAQGQEIIDEQTGLIIAWTGTRPLSQREMKDLGYNNPSSFRNYRNIYAEAVRFPPTSRRRFKGVKALNEYLQEIPEPYNLETECGQYRIVIPTKELTLLYGQPESGKTWVALNIARYLELETLYIATESAPGIAARMKLLGASQFDKVEVFDGIPTPADIRKLAELKHHLLIVDVLADIINLLGDENRATGWQAFRNFILPVSDKRTSVIVHHEGKNRASGARGTSAITAAMTNIYLISSEWNEAEHCRNINIKKGKDRNDLRPDNLQIQLIQSDKFHAKIYQLPKDGETQTRNDKEIIAAFRKAEKEAKAETGKPPSPNRIKSWIEADFNCGGTKSDKLLKQHQDLFILTPKAASQGGTGYRLKTDDDKEQA